MKVLIITHNEICYNIRLLKAADFLSEQGNDVTIFNPVLGLGNRDVYLNTIKSKKWKIIENDLSKSTPSSWVNWFFISLINKLCLFFWKYFHSNIGFDYCLNKGLIGASRKIKGPYDLIIVHLVDTLPFATKLKKKWNAKLIYDSQEYFVGQFAKYAPHLLAWVKVAEKVCIENADLVIATTNIMGERLKSDYTLKMPVLRVRNTPSLLMNKISKQHPIDSFYPKRKTLDLIWHGFGIYLNNTRGLHIVIKAIPLCKHPVRLFLQGILHPNEAITLNGYLDSLQIRDKVFTLPPADPYQIVDSISMYDIGVSGELLEEENQLLTSTNKLFDYIDSGLAVICPEIAGHKETIEEFNVGLMYPSGDFAALAKQIDWMAEHPEALQQFRLNAMAAAKAELYWEHDYAAVWQRIQSLG